MIDPSAGRIDLDRDEIPFAVMTRLPLSVVLRHEALPVRLDGRALVVGIAALLDEAALDEIAFAASVDEVRQAIFERAALRRAIERVRALVTAPGALGPSGPSGPIDREDEADA